jgi:starch synthase
VVLADDLSIRQRAIRRLLCTRLVPVDSAGFTNVDLFRYRAEWTAGIIAEEKIREVEKTTSRIDVLHFHRQGTAYSSLDRMKRTPSIVSIDCTQSMHAGRARNSIEKLTFEPNFRRDGKVFAAAKLIISTSEWAAACLRREYPDCETEIAVRPNPVETSVFSDKLSEERLARSATSARKIEVLFLGGDFERKGGPDLLEAWEQGRFSEVATLKIVTGKDVPVRQYDGVAWLSGISVYTDEWLNLWRTADVFVMPTREEAFGNVFQEASAAGLPSIATRITAVPEVVIEGETGLLIPNGNVTELVNALKTLIESPEMRYRMGTAARLHVEKTSDPNNYAAFLAMTIRRLVKR